ncbi:hypothetical protein [Pseudidiomarina aestuarii]|uniref:hypothetical protein n=1 Tax=Pseudidiomarina aestuarii TaxID=624146 RepID=UPI003A9734AF
MSSGTLKARLLPPLIYLPVVCSMLGAVIASLHHWALDPLSELCFNLLRVEVALLSVAVAGWLLNICLLLRLWKGCIRLFDHAVTGILLPPLFGTLAMALDVITLVYGA